MKRMVFSLSFLLFVSGMYAQITLEECQRKTQENYPLVHQYGLVEKTKEYNLENAAKGYLPQFALSAMELPVNENHRRNSIWWKENILTIKQFIIRKYEYENLCSFSISLFDDET